VRKRTEPAARLVLWSYRLHNEQKVKLRIDLEYFLGFRTIEDVAQ
jgi:hypothetical protein